MSTPRIDHIGIAVQSLDAALAFYRDALGLEAKGLVTVPQEKVRVAMLPAGEPRVELLEATSEDSPIARFLAKRGEGMHHVAYAVPDLEAALAERKAAGARLIDEVPRRGAHGWRIAFIHPESCGGVLTELVEE